MWQVVVAAVFWLALTALAAKLAGRYDKWITLAHREDESKAESRRVVPTSLLVVFGVFGNELLRVARWALVIWALLPYVGLEGYTIVVILCTGTLWVFDCLASYGVTGAWMIRGDLQREATQKAECQAIRLAAVGQLAEGGRVEYGEHSRGKELETGQSQCPDQPARDC